MANSSLPNLTCSVEECKNTPYRRGICSKHVERERLSKQTELCSMQFCSKLVYRGDLCRPHVNEKRERDQKRRCSVEGCNKKLHANGLCSIHDSRRRRHGDVAVTERNIGEGETRESRFWSKTKRVGTCLEWQGSLDVDGYGQINYRFDGKSFRLAHRFAYFLKNGCLPEAVRHTCDNSRCCDPDHLVEGTQIQNIADKIERNRQAKGAKVGGSILSESEVRKIMTMQRSGVDRKEIISAIGHAPSAVRHVLDGHTWQHLK